MSNSRKVLWRQIDLLAGAGVEDLDLQPLARVLDRLS